MKIATLTFHRALNYGAVLQTYALQKTLIGLGYDTEVLDYRSEFIEHHYAPDKISNYFTPKKMAILILLNGCSVVKRSQFESFVNNNIKMSKTVYDKNNIVESEKIYDSFLVGSDQVWNYRTTGFDKCYYLNFIKNKEKKMSYAASVGLSQIPEDVEGEYKKLLKPFNKISVREQEGNDLLSQILSREDIETVLDPTMLLDASEWSTLCVPCNTPKKYILVYLLSENRKIVKFAKKLAKKTGYEIIYINNQLLKRSGFINKRDVTPENWLYLFKNADYIVTNSFHGTVFSIIFRKVFWTDYLPTRANVNSRITTLLGNLGLKERIISEGCDVDILTIDYKLPSEKLDALIDKSKKFLEKLGE